MKNLKNLGKTLNRKQQKEINGGLIGPGRCLTFLEACRECGGIVSDPICAARPGINDNLFRGCIQSVIQLTCGSTPIGH